MSSYLQIEGDPSRWWPSEPIDLGMLTSLPLRVQVTSPLAGTLLVSAKSAAVVLAHPATDGSIPSGHGEIAAPAIYLPTATGPSAGAVGYQLPESPDLETLATEIITAMRDSRRLVITIGSPARPGTLVLNGATLPFVVLCQATVSGRPPGSIPSGHERERSGHERERSGHERERSGDPG